MTQFSGNDRGMCSSEHFLLRKAQSKRPFLSALQEGGREWRQLHTFATFYSFYYIHPCSSCDVVFHALFRFCRGSRGAGQSIIHIMASFLDDAEEDPFNCFGEEPDDELPPEDWAVVLPTEESHQAHLELFEPQCQEEEPPQEPTQGGEDGNQPEATESASSDAVVEETWVAAVVDPYMTSVSASLVLPTLTSEVGGSLQTPRKRRRLTTKTTPEKQYESSPQKGQLSEHTSFQEVAKVVLQVTNGKRLREIYDEFNRAGLRKQHPHLRYQELTNILRQEWNDKSEVDRKQWILDWLESTGNLHLLPSKMAQFDAMQRQAWKGEEDMMKVDKNWFRSCACMGTWNGSWLKGNKEYEDFLSQHGFGEAQASQLRELPCVRAFAARFAKFLEERIARLGFKFYSFVIEMSLHAKEEGRLHLHAYWHSPQNQTESRVFAGTAHGWGFEGSMPILRTNTAKGRNVDRAINQGHYYCQCDKLGTVVSVTNYEKYVQYAVEQKWVMSLWQKRKLSHEKAKKEVIGARGHTKSYLQEIRTIEELEEAAEIENEKRMIDLLIGGHLKPFRWLPEVALWKLQYDREHEMGMWGRTNRFKFLVLTGPSSLGKTMFAKSLFGQESTLVVPSQKVTIPDLHDFKRRKHKAIVFDEIESPCVAANKQIFQANSDVAILGQSPTGDYIYKRLLYGTAMILCTNTWMENIDRASSEEEWLLTNAIVVECTEKLWVA